MGFWYNTTMTKTPEKTALCSWCGKPKKLMPNGNVASHMLPSKFGGEQQMGRRMCGGSGQEPLPAPVQQ